MPQGKWSEEEDELLRAGAPVPGRSSQSVRDRRCKLGITQKRSRTWEWRPWAAEEDAAVLDGAVSLPGRTEGAVRARRLHLGVVLQEREPGRPWTDEELRILVDEWQTCSRAEMGERLGRSWTAVSQKLRSLGLGYEQGDQVQWSLSGEQHPWWRGGSVASGNYGREWRRFIRPAVIERDESRCRACGRPDDLQVHHVDPYCETQDHSLENQVTLCSSCHKWAENTLQREIMKQALRTGEFGEVRALRALMPNTRVRADVKSKASI